MASDVIRIRVLGQSVIDAVKAIACNPVVNEDYVNGKTVFVLGQSSKYSYEDLIVTDLDGKSIDPNETYEGLLISTHGWSGRKYMVASGPEANINALKEFVKKLEEELSKHKILEAPAVPAPMTIWFEFEGTKYECPVDADKKNKIVLPDGRVIAASNGWKESYPPSPRDLKVIDTIAVATIRK